MKDNKPTLYASSSCSSQTFNGCIQMIKMWKNNPIFNVSFPLVKHLFTILEYTRDISNIYVSTIFIS